MDDIYLDEVCRDTDSFSLYFTTFNAQLTSFDCQCSNYCILPQERKLGIVEGKRKYTRLPSESLQRHQTIDNQPNSSSNHNQVQDSHLPNPTLPPNIQFNWGYSQPQYHRHPLLAGKNRYVIDTQQPYETDIINLDFMFMCTIGLQFSFLKSDIFFTYGSK